VHNEGTDALRKLAEKKARSAKNVVRAKVEEDVATDAEIVDLMDVLQRSLKGHVQKQGATQLKGTVKPARRKAG
jgi:non-homologous end joining protein Ku